MLSLDTGEWRPIEAAVGPEARYQHAAVWLPGRGMLLYGGQNGAPLGDMWLLSFRPPATEAPAEPAPTQPPAEPTATPTVEPVSEHDGQ
jgi:hypothetical protein